MEFPLSSLMKTIKRSNRLLWISIFGGLMTIVTSCVFLVSRVNFSERPDSLECQKCHKEIYDQWILSPHSRATQGERFIMLTDNLRLNECVSCHSPQTIWTKGAPLSASFQSVQKGRGVDCASCHWQEGKIIAGEGSYEAQRSHPLEVSDSLRVDSYVCGQCHRKPYQEMQTFKNLSSRVTCQHCHIERLSEEKLKTPEMANRKRRLESEKFIAHTFRIEDLAEFPSAIAVKVDSPVFTTETLTINFTLVNYLPHSIPAVEYGNNQVFVSAEVFLSGSDKILKKENVFNRQKPIKPFSENAFKYSFRIGDEKVDLAVIKVLHQRKKNTKKIMIFSKEINLNSSGSNK